MSFISRDEDVYLGAFNGMNSKIGYLAFEGYLVNISDGLPNPFFYLG